MHFKNIHAVVCIDYFSGYVFYDEIPNESSTSVIKVLNNVFQKFWPAERIISDNGPCFKSAEFRDFCVKFEVKHTTSSPHYHEGNGRAERAIQSVKQMLKKSKNVMDFTLALLTYHDTPISDCLPCPAELLFNRRTNSRLAPIHQNINLNDQQRTDLLRKRSKHIEKDSEQMIYEPGQSVWFTEDHSSEWKSGFIESKDSQPHSYWVISENQRRRVRRNRHDIKTRHPKSPSHVESHVCAPFVNNVPKLPVNVTMPIPDPDPPDHDTPPRSNHTENGVPIKSESTEIECNTTPMVTRSGREIKSTKSSDFIYG